MLVYSHSYWLGFFCTTNRSRVMARVRLQARKKTKYLMKWTPCIYNMYTECNCEGILVLLPVQDGPGQVEGGQDIQVSIYLSIYLFIYIYLSICIYLSTHDDGRPRTLFSCICMYTCVQVHLFICYQLPYEPLYPLVGCFVGRSVGWSVVLPAIISWKGGMLFFQARTGALDLFCYPLLRSGQLSFLVFYCFCNIPLALLFRCSCGKIPKYVCKFCPKCKCKFNYLSKWGGACYIATFHATYKSTA